MYTPAADRITALSSLLKKSQRISIVAHTKPDGDAVGSSTAMLHYLCDMLGKDAAILLPNPAGSHLAFVQDDFAKGRTYAWSEDEKACRERLAASDLIVCLDFNTFSRTDAMAPALEASPAARVLIDHHPFPDTAAFAVVFSDPGISSTCELLFWVLLAMEDVHGDAGLLPHRSLYALMTGMTTDTNNFANSVVPSTLEMASLLLSAGVDRNEILGHLYNEFGENRLRLMGWYLDNMVVTSQGAALVVINSEELERFNVGEGDTEGLVNMPLSIGSVKLSAFLREDEGFYRVSLRSKAGTSANAFARRFCNGGGHEQASGGRIFIPADVASREGVTAYMLGALEEYLEKE